MDQEMDRRHELYAHDLAGLYRGSVIDREGTPKPFSQPERLGFPRLDSKICLELSNGFRIPRLLHLDLPFSDESPDEQRIQAVLEKAFLFHLLRDNDRDVLRALSQ